MIKHITFTAMGYDQAMLLRLREDNRLINHQHVNKILKKMIEDFDAIPCIRVNKRTNTIIDGQHRYKAYIRAIEEGLIPKDTKLMVEYLDIPIEEEVNAIIESNINSKNWKLDDYINLYVKQGSEVYKRLGTWCKEHALAFDDGKPKYRYGAAMITGKHCGAAMKNGEFYISDQELKKADEIHAELMNIIEILGLSENGAWIEPLAISWHQHRDMHTFKVWLSQMKVPTTKNRLIKMPKSNVKEWDSIFAQVHTAIDKRIAKAV